MTTKQAMLELADRIEAALEQAQDCIKGETPEDISDQEAREDTISKIRSALFDDLPALRSAQQAEAGEAAAIEAMEACAKLCDAHARWAEEQIEGDPESKKSQMFALISNTANDCASMIRDRYPVVGAAQQAEAGEPPPFPDDPTPEMREAASYYLGSVDITDCWRAMMATLKHHPTPVVGADVREALLALYEWYDRDGSVGGASEVFEAHRAALSDAVTDTGGRALAVPPPSREAIARLVCCGPKGCILDSADCVCIAMDPQYGNTETADAILATISPFPSPVTDTGGGGSQTSSTESKACRFPACDLVNCQCQQDRGGK